MRLHQLVAFGVGEGTVFDGIDPQHHGLVDGPLAVGVGRDLHAQSVRCLHHSFDFIIGHKLLIWIVAVG